MEDLAMEWASAPHPDTGRSYYPPANKSSHTVEEVKSALMSAREGGAGKYMSAAPVSSLRSRGSGMRRSGSSKLSGGKTDESMSGGGGYLDQIKKLFLGAIGSGGGSGRSSSSSSSSVNVDIRPNKPAPDVGDANDGGGSLPLGNMKLGQNSKKSAPEPPSQSQSSVSQISETQRRRDARRSTSSKKYSGEANSIGPKHPVPRETSKSKTLGVLV